MTEPNPHSPEQQGFNPEFFTKAVDIVSKLQEDGRFIQACQAQGIDPHEDIATEGYWQTFTDFTSEKCQELLDKGANPEQIHSLDLLAATPDFLYQQAKLDDLQTIVNRGGVRALSPGQRTEWDRAKDVASTFNARIRGFVMDHPNSMKNDLTVGLQKILPFSIEGEHAKQNAKTKLEQIMRGAQHEIGFGQILEKTGRQFRPSESVQEDRAGIDYVIDEGTHDELRVDVKASLSEVEAKGSMGAFARKPDGAIVMYSLIKDAEFNGGFFISDMAAELKSEALNQQLSLAAKVA